MTSKVLACWAAGTALLFALACTGDSDLAAPGALTAPDSVKAEAVNIHAVRVQWHATPAAATYQLERRANLTGAFEIVAGSVAGETTTYFDTSVEPETFYGYRVIAVSRLGDHSSPSVVAGTVTPPAPGIVVKTSVADPSRADVDGYHLTIHGITVDTTIDAAMDIATSTRFSPLRSGDYRIELTGVAPNCKIRDDSTRTVSVAADGLTTLRQVDFVADCRNPERGQITFNVHTTGDSVDVDGYQLVLTGVASDLSLPDDQRAYLQRKSTASEGTVAFTDLRPGQYSLTMEGLAGNCTPPNGLPLTIPVDRLDDVIRTLTVRCTRPNDDPTRPMVLESRWSTPSAPSGALVSLDVSLAIPQATGKSIAEIQGILGVDPTVVRWDSAAHQGPWQGRVNETSPGQISWFAYVNGAGKSGTATFVRIYFTVIGATGSSVTTGQALSVATSGEPDETARISLIPLIRRVEGTLTVGGTGGGGGSGGGTSGGQNQAPVARPGTAYSGVAGTPVSFSGSASSDPDGSIATYQWSFGDGGSASGATPSHTYSAAGSYTATLTVTDDDGAQNSATVPVTITAGGGGSGPFIWSSTFGAVNGGNIVTLTVALDLSANIDQTPGSEALQSWAVSELRWDPNVLQFFSFNFGPGLFGTVNTTNALQGKLSFNSGAQSYNLTGIIPVATIQFTALGGTGSTTTTHTTLGALTGTAATGAFNYTPKTMVTEGVFPAPTSPPPPPPPPPAAKYQYRATWGAITGGQVSLTLSFDPTTYNDPAVDGAAVDDVTQFQANLAYNTARLQWESCSNASTGAGGFTNLNANETAPGQVSILNFKNGAGATTAITTAVCTFTIKPGTAASVTTATTLVVLSSFDGTDLIANTQVNEGTLAVP